jgi:hypothetical protein
LGSELLRVKLAIVDKDRASGISAAKDDLMSITRARSIEVVESEAAGIEIVP